MGPLTRGFLIGAIVAACAVVWWLILLMVGAVRSSRGLDLVYPGQIAILAVGYLAGLVAAVRRPTRRIGLGMLIGVTLTFPGLFMATFGVMKIGGGR